MNWVTESELINLKLSIFDQISTNTIILQFWRAKDRVQVSRLAIMDIYKQSTAWTPPTGEGFVESWNQTAQPQSYAKRHSHVAIAVALPPHAHASWNATHVGLLVAIHAINTRRCWWLTIACAKQTRKRNCLEFQCPMSYFASCLGCLGICFIISTEQRNNHILEFGTTLKLKWFHLNSNKTYQS